MFLFHATFLLLVVLPSQSLICPVYNVYNNETSPIVSCDDPLSSCTYTTVSSLFRRCLGLYTFDNDARMREKRIRIRQLAVIDDLEDRYANRTNCILDIDKTGQNLLCRCNADNCTLKWRTAENFDDDLFEKRRDTHPSLVTEAGEENNWFLPITLILFIIILSTLALILVVISYNYRRAEKDDRSYFTDFSSTSASTSHTDIDVFLSSDATDQSMINQGKSSIIYRAWTTGRATGEHEKKLVAVKVYRGLEYKQIADNEVEILRLIDHSAIISLISSGWHGPSPYLIFEYYPAGSLTAYLSEQKLAWPTCYSFLHSLLQAIDYLHYEDLSPTDYFTSHRIRKPIIIHRDIKSANILVRSPANVSLCLADFGFAKVLPAVLTSNDFIQIGTYRYMAPELLELAISHTSEALCKVDIYAVGLVMWEIISQCDDYPCSTEYQLPYAEYVSANETNDNRILDTLHRVVVNERKRPIVHRTTTIQPNIAEVLTIIEDCWKHEPDSRINARPALSRLQRLQSNTQSFI